MLSLLIYLFAPPGVIRGWIDLSNIKIFRKFNLKNNFLKEDLDLTKKIGGGGFGEVYLGTLDTKDGPQEVAVKKAKEFG